MLSFRGAFIDMAGVGEVMGGLGGRRKEKQAKKYLQTREMLMMLIVQGKNLLETRGILIMLIVLIFGGKHSLKRGGI